MVNVTLYIAYMDPSWVTMFLTMAFDKNVAFFHGSLHLIGHVSGTCLPSALLAAALGVWRKTMRGVPVSEIASSDGWTRIRYFVLVLPPVFCMDPVA